MQKHSTRKRICYFPRPGHARVETGNCKTGKLKLGNILKCWTSVWELFIPLFIILTHYSQSHWSILAVRPYHHCYNCCTTDNALSTSYVLMMLSLPTRIQVLEHTESPKRKNNDRNLLWWQYFLITVLTLKKTGVDITRCRHLKCLRVSIKNKRLGNLTNGVILQRHRFPKWAVSTPVDAETFQGA